MGVTAGDSYKIGTDEVLSAGTLGATILASSLTSVGTLVSLDVTGAVSVGDTVTATEFYGDGSNLTGISASNVDLTGTSQSFANLELTAAGVALTVTNDASIGNDLTVTNDITVGNDILPRYPWYRFYW